MEKSHSFECEYTCEYIVKGIFNVCIQTNSPKSLSNLLQKIYLCCNFITFGQKARELNISGFPGGTPNLNKQIIRQFK